MRIAVPASVLASALVTLALTGLEAQEAHSRVGRDGRKDIRDRIEDRWD